MKLLCFERFEELDFPKLMEIYRESNLENIPYFFPEETDRARGLRRVEAGFRDYLKDEFFTGRGRRYYVLADGERWASALRLCPIPGKERAWYAEALETAPDCRRRGYARKLLELLCYALAKGGPFELTDSVSRGNLPSLGFHESTGFTVFQEAAVNPLNGEENPRAKGLRYRFGGWEARAVDPARLSKRFAVRRLTEAELPELLELCEGNPLYYRHCPPAPSAETLLGDMAALPPRRTLNDKYYLGFFDEGRPVTAPTEGGRPMTAPTEEGGRQGAVPTEEGRPMTAPTGGGRPMTAPTEGGRLIAVLDMIPGYPRPETVFWGFLMLRAELQGQGRGTALVSELCAALAELGYQAVRLGWVKTNLRAARFWKKNGFVETGIAYDAGDYTVVVAEKQLT